MEEIHHLLPGPVLLMHSSIDNKPDGSPHFVLQAAVIAVCVLIESNLFSEALRVERPAFDKSRVLGMPAKHRQLWQFLSNGDLQMVSRHAFMVGDGFDIQGQTMLRIPLVNVDPPRT